MKSLAFIIITYFVASLTSTVAIEATVEEGRYEKGIDVLPGKFCEGETELYRVVDGKQVFKYSHKETDKPKTFAKGKFYGMYRFHYYERDEIKAMVTGGCCWEYYSQQGFGGKKQYLGLGVEKYMPFSAKSVRIVKCETSFEDTLHLTGL